MKTILSHFKVVSLSVALILSLNFAQAQTESIPSGSFIVNMGVVPQTYANGLKPWGMIWDLIHNYKAQFKWIISPTKVKDGVDFSYNGIDYRGGSFILPAKYRTPDVNARIAYWQSQGVVGVTTTSIFSVNVAYTLKYTPRWTFDFQNGNIALGYLEAAGIPTIAYPKKDPEQLNECDDLFVMPHADPTWPTHKNLLAWNKNTRGWLWYGCHAVSVIENLADPMDNNKKMNFLTTTGLIPFNDHDNPNTPFSYRYQSDPEMQFLGKIEDGVSNGSEQVFLPKLGGAWRPQTKVAVWDAANSEVPSSSPGEAAILAYGRAFGNINNGKVMFSGGHNHNKNNPDAVSAIRTFFNFSFMSVAEKEIVPTLTGPFNLQAGNTYSFTVSLPAGYNAANYSFNWTSSCGGTFSNQFGTTTNFTPVAPAGTACSNCRVIVTVTDACGREYYQSTDLTVCPVPPVAKNIVTSIITNNPGTGAQTLGNAFPLAGTDADGTVEKYSIKSLPNSGKLFWDHDNNVATTDAEITSIPAGGLALNKAQTKSVKFDPDDNYNGNVSFQYSVTDNSTLESVQNATYTIPVNTPPVTKTFVCTPVPSNNGLFSVCPMEATDNGTIISYKVVTLPSPSQCVIYLYGSKVVAGQVLTPEQASQLTCTPSGNFMGYAQITYTATDDKGASDPKPSTLTLQFVNQPPVPKDMSASYISDATIISNISSLSATDIDGTITSYTVTNIPASNQGQLFYNAGGSNVAITDNTVLTPAQANNLRFKPFATFTGIATFKYTATDNGGLTANNLATYSIPVKAKPPVAKDISDQSSIYTGAGMASIKSLSATVSDPTTTLVSYIITQLPAAGSGVLYYNNGSSYVPVVQNAEISIAQGSTLKFTPAAPFTGNAIFNYTVKDNKGLKDPTPAKFTIPVGNKLPKSINITTPDISDEEGQVPIPALQGTDEDGSVASFVIISIPDAEKGILYYNNTPVTPGTLIPVANSGNLKFDPVLHNDRDAKFKYTTIDNMGGKDADGAEYEINIKMVPYKKAPKAKNVVNPAVTIKAEKNKLLPMDGYDPEGVITSYRITSLPKASQGQLLIQGLPVVTNQVVGSVAADELTFVPTGTFIGNSTFSYQSINGDTLSSTDASFTIPVINTKPIVSDIALNAVKRSSTTQIAPLRATDADGTISKFKILTAPGLGVLQYDPTGNNSYQNVPLYSVNNWSDSVGTFVRKDTVTTINYIYDMYGNVSGQDTVVTINDIYNWVVTHHSDTTFGTALLSAAQATRLRFVASGNIGTTSFTYTAIDNLNEVSNVATYTIPVSTAADNQAPVANNVISAPVSVGNTLTPINPLVSTDYDGIVSSYTILNIPPAYQGRIYWYNSTTFTYEPITVASFSVTPAQAATLKFLPAGIFVGNVIINYNAVDDNGAISDMAVLTIPVVNSGPVTTSITNPALPSNNGPTSLSALSATAPAGLKGFVITKLPSPLQGKLILDGAEVTLNQVITSIHAGRLEFDPDSAFSGNASFGFAAVDNFTKTSTPSTFTIPVTNALPVAKDVKSQVITNVNGVGVQNLPTLSGYDNDGTISNFIIKSLPAGGTLYKSGTLITSLPANGLSISTAQAAQLSFAPDANASGVQTFTYTVKDNSNNISANVAIYQIPLNLPPVATNKSAPAMSADQVKTSIPSLSATDDGSVSKYTIQSLPPVFDGKLYLNNVEVTSLSQVASLTPAQVATLSFKPSASFAGTIFTYTALDDMGIIDVTPAVYTIPYSGPMVVLPVKLVRFTGKKADKDDVLEWTTAEELNVDHFEVEYSIDGNNYKVISSVHAKGNSSVETNYSYTHQQVQANIGYYRLKMIDKDNNHTYSNVVMLKRDNINVMLSHVYPNPFADELNISITSQIVSRAKVYLYDLNGKAIRSLPIEIQKGMNALSFQNLQALGAGTYIVAVKGEDINFTAKVVKAK